MTAYISVVTSPLGQKRPDMKCITLITYQTHGREAEFRLLQEIQSKWYDIGLELNVPVNTMESHKTNEEKCRDVLRTWLENGAPRYPVEWDSLVKVLHKVQMRAVANELREALNYQIFHRLLN